EVSPDRMLDDVGALANERGELEELVGRRTRQQRLQDRQEDAAGMLAGEPARREEGDDSGPRDDCEPGTEPRVGRRPRQARRWPCSGAPACPRRTPRR